MREKKLDIDRLKKNVRPPQINTGKEEEAWRHYDITNCYSYALGLFEDIEYLRPGEIAEMEYKKEYSDEEILERVKRDLEVLGIEATESSFEEVIEDEYTWKIAILNVATGDTKVFYDYHFLKQGMNKKWYHKQPYDQFPSRFDSRNKEIENPETATYSFHYHLVAYLAVRQVQTVRA